MTHCAIKCFIICIILIKRNLNSITHLIKEAVYDSALKYNYDSMAYHRQHRTACIIHYTLCTCIIYKKIRYCQEYIRNVCIYNHVPTKIFKLRSIE